METFLHAFYNGIWHVFNWPNFTLLLFILAVAVVATFKDWKALLYISLLFTLGVVLGYLASLSEVYKLPADVLNDAHLAILLLFAIFNLTSPGKTIRAAFRYYLAVLLGLTAGYALKNATFSSMFSNTKWTDFASFTVGIEVAIILGFLGVLLLSWLFANAFKIPKKDFSLILSGAVMGVSALKLLEAIF